MRAGLVLLALMLAAPAAPAAAQDFTWRGALAQGDEIEIRGVNGDVRAVRARGGEVAVRARKDGDRSDPDEVRIEVVEHGGGVTICAVYPHRNRDRPNECRPGGGRHSTHDNDVEVHFTVEVPAGVVLRAVTVNGDVTVADLESNVRANTVNGSIDVTTTGFAEAETVNGSITAVMGRSDWTGALDFETVNGAITVTLPAGVGAELEARTVNGSIESDFPVTIRGRFGPRSVRGMLGDGGRDLRMRTVNGSIRIRRG